MVDTNKLFELAKEMAILEMNQKRIRTRVKEIRSLLGDFKVGHEEDGTLSNRIVSYLQQRGGPIAVKEIAEGVKGKRPSVNASLWRMQKEGLLSKAGRGYYIAKAS